MSANSGRALVAMCRSLAERHSWTISTSGADWVVRLADRAGHRVGIYGYSFDLNPAAVALICDDKVATAQLLSAAGVAAVPHELVIAPEFGRWVGQSSVGRRTDELTETFGWPLVVKPNDGTGGADVHRAADRGAVEVALGGILTRHRGAAIGPWREVVAEHRVLVVDGTTPLIYRKDRPKVIGDGTSTVIELVSSAIVADEIGPDNVRDWIDTHDPSLLRRVPAHDELVHLGLRHNLGTGSTPVLVDDGPRFDELSQLALRAAAELGAVFCSVDIVDSEAGTEVLEVNSGVMLERLATESTAWWRRAEAIYEAALLIALEA